MSYEFNEDKIKNMTSVIATISYEIENASYNGVSFERMNKQILELQKNNNFPSKPQTHQY